ncbi:hypothetical protein [Microlunatus soli]|uniref:Uncharacterized protein n=1 Tax=Microlunatus soli TaxID=630515 RepID=A0A1H1X082_9ACTN|nr:hypothetical protein [Microlunatus soli]SDT02755.1 hypothetical protein SAMN04489812_3883 [Microlunatus soli]
MARKQRKDNRPNRPGGKDGGSTTGSVRRTRLSTAQTVAKARRTERLEELRRLRDSTDPAGTPEKSDRPDFGHRPNVADLQPSSSGRRAGLIGGGIALLLVVGLVVGFLAFGPQRTAPAAGGDPSASAAAPATMIGPQTMLTAAEAKTIDGQNWSVRNDQTPGEQNVPVPACLGAVSKDAPKPAESLIRTLSAGEGGSTTLHLAQAYKTPEQATEGYALLAKALGECQLKGSYISGARVITGLGDQATGIELENLIKDSHRAVTLNRTGRMVNVVDVAATKKTPDLDKTAKAMASVTDLQCTIAVGLCASGVKISDGPPPIGGDQPGFLATGDIPTPTNGKGTWGGLEPGSPENVTTSGCENIDFNLLQADNRAARSYVLTDKPKGMPKKFGVDEITLTMRSKKAASEAVKNVVDNLKSCEDRLPAATVSDLSTVSGTGASGAEISGSAALVNQKVSDSETSRYRVGIVSAGNKLVYTFLYRDGDWDMTKDQWTMLTSRAAERATQIR